MDGAAVVALAARALVGGVMLAAGVAKLRSRDSLLLDAILSFEIVPAWATKPIARSLPWLECALGAALILGVGTRGVAMAAFVLMAALTAGLVHALGRGKRVVCPCFGFTGEEISRYQWSIAGRNFVLMVAAITASHLEDPVRVDRFFAWFTFGTDRTAEMAVVLSVLVMYCLWVRARWRDGDGPSSRQNRTPHTVR